MKGQLRMSGNDQRSSRSLRRPAKGLLIDRPQLGEQWTACLEIGFSVRCQRQTAGAALKQCNAEALLE